MSSASTSPSVTVKTTTQAKTTCPAACPATTTTASTALASSQSAKRVCPQLRFDHELVMHLPYHQRQIILSPDGMYRLPVLHMELVQSDCNQPRLLNRQQFRLLFVQLLKLLRKEDENCFSTSISLSVKSGAANPPSSNIKSTTTQSTTNNSHHCVDGTGHVVAVGRSPTWLSTSTSISWFITKEGSTKEEMNEIL